MSRWIQGRLSTIWSQFLGRILDFGIQSALICAGPGRKGRAMRPKSILNQLRPHEAQLRKIYGLKDLTFMDLCKTGKAAGHRTLRFLADFCAVPSPFDVVRLESSLGEILHREVVLRFKSPATTDGNPPKDPNCL